MRPIGAQTSGDDSLTLQLGASMEAAATARRALARLRADIDPPLMETLRLLVTELVTNSVRHARSDDVVLRVLVGPSAVWTEVTDTGPGFDPAATGLRATTAAAGDCSSSSGSPTAGAPRTTRAPPRSGSSCGAASAASAASGASA